jgi:hypothetical protein
MLGILAAFGLLLSLAAPAAAQDQAVVDKVAKLNKKAVDEYENLNFDEARKLLQSALDLAAKGGLDKHDVTARTYVHLGIVSFAGFKEKTEAIKFFRRALAIQPGIKLDKSLASPEIQEVYDQAVAEEKGESSGGGGEVTPTVVPRADAISHTPVMRATQGKPIVIKATIDPGVGAKKVILSFNTDNSDDFGEQQMKEDPAVAGAWSGEIPASATKGATVGYYIEAQGDDEKTLATKGSERTPLKIKIVGPGGQAAGGKKPAPKQGGAPTWFLGLGIGSGFGWATGSGEVSSFHTIKPAGLAPAKLLHFTPEVGYYLGPDLLLSVQLRIQLVTGPTPYYDAAHPDKDPQCGSSGVCNAATYALAGLARLSWFLTNGDFRPYVAGVAGAGQIRHVVTFKSIPDCGKDGSTTCVDTIAAGPVLFGGGAGFLYELGSGFSLTLGTNLLLGAPNFTFNVDVNAGIGVEF